MTLPARATAALSRFDGPLNALADSSPRLVPWAWWPIDPPRRDRPYGPREHAVYLGWSVAGFAVGEAAVALIPEEDRPRGTRLGVERAVTLAGAGALWLATAGAWDRRAAALRRRPWRRLARRG
jgi:hypothetical protein